MIANSSTKIAIKQSYRSLETVYNKYELIATQILLYKYILSFTEANPEQKNDINSLVLSYSSKFKTKFIELKNRYSSYQNIINFLKKIDANNLLSMKESDIDKVYTIYTSSKPLVQFNNIYFDPMMYNADNISSTEIEYLKTVHFNIICKIFKYCNAVYETQYTDFKIISSTEVPGNAGKIIIFTINNVSPALIYSDIMNKKIAASGFTCDLEFPNIKLTIL